MATPAKSLETGTQLAADRTRLAYERTLMAWIRTATSLISFGFTIYKFFDFQAGRGIATTDRLLSPRVFAMILIGTGLVALVLSTIEHRRNIGRLEVEFEMTQPSTAGILAAIVSVMGLIAFVAALVRG